MSFNIAVPLLIYCILINIISAAMAYSDKIRAVKGKRRISERALMLAGILGGAAGELAVMKLIRHKTKHIKFMVGLPLCIFIHIAAAALLISKTAV